MFPLARITSPVQRHFYFSRLPRLWNFLPHFDLNKLIQSIKSDIKAFFWKRFLETFDPTKPCTFHVVSLVPDALLYLYPQTVTGLLVPILTRPSVYNHLFVCFCGLFLFLSFMSVVHFRLYCKAIIIIIIIIIIIV